MKRIRDYTVFLLSQQGPTIDDKFYKLALTQVPFNVLHFIAEEIEYKTYVYRYTLIRDVLVERMEQNAHEI